MRQLHVSFTKSEYVHASIIVQGVTRPTLTKVGDSWIPAFASTMDEWVSVMKSLETTCKSSIEVSVQVPGDQGCTHNAPSCKVIECQM